eukprot:6214282-Pleurochrysis_carterae.AAC.2
MKKIYVCSIRPGDKAIVAVTPSYYSDSDVSKFCTSPLPPAPPSPPRPPPSPPPPRPPADGAVCINDCGKGFATDGRFASDGLCDGKPHPHAKRRRPYLHAPQLPSHSPPLAL